MILGCDISKHNGTPIPDAVLADLDRQGVDFAFARASIGTLPDPAYTRNRAKFEARGWVGGGYHFLYPDAFVSATAQARVFIAQMRAGGPGIGRSLTVYDAEWIAGDNDPDYDDCARFYRAFKAAMPDHPLGIYTAAGYWSGYLGRKDLRAIADFLWDARWPDGMTPTRLPSVSLAGGYGGFGRTPLWQWGSLHAAGKGIDGNAWYGTRAALEALTGAPAPAPPVEDDDVQIVKERALAPGSRWKAPQGADVLALRLDADYQETSRRTRTLASDSGNTVDRLIVVSRPKGSGYNGTFVHVTGGQFQDEWLGVFAADGVTIVEPAPAAVDLAPAAAAVVQAATTAKAARDAAAAATAAADATIGAVGKASAAIAAAQ